MTRTPPGAAEIRRLFVDFFVARGHTHVESSSLVPQNDPTLLFVNAGMNQFKDVFTGREERPYTRAVTVQRCLRAGGKHNDLDNVGFTPRHHTLFEMLGNFSFGDYFKAEAIAWAWEFLTETLAIPGRRLVVTVYDGTGEAAPQDDEAFALWRRFVPEDRIYRCSAKDNFWQMGDTGPCGPCSEIHLFHGDEAPGLAGVPGRGPAFEPDRYLELWNLVFMQYEKHEDGSLTRLPKPSIDTGAGLERIAATVVGASSNYGTDLLAPLVDRAKALAGGSHGHDSLHGPSGPGEAPFRVIADHARATAFLIADGVFPDKDGRAYVLRRIMRRAIRHGTDVGLHEPFFHDVCQRVVELFGDAYPILRERAATIREVVQTEELAFRRTLDRGLRLLERELATLGEGQALAPEIAADLYTTYGFPIDLTGVILAERGKTLDEEAARKLTRGASGRGSALGSDERIDDLYFALHAELGDSEFLGYEVTEAEGEIRAIVQDGRRVLSASEGDAVELVLSRTPFYAEGGGQVGDAGTIVGADPDAFAVEITDTRKPVGVLHVHRGEVKRGRLEVGARVIARVDVARRDAIRRNHSATHLLHLALREELGEHVAQKGSEVSPTRLRFDYSHNRPLTEDQKRRIEARVNALVLRNQSSQTEILAPEAAKQKGAIGLFEAKYGERVRVVRIGGDSLELCGGTHVARSGDIGLFVIVSDANLAQGVRRIEAVTGLNALAYLQTLGEVTRTAMGQLHVGTVTELPTRIEKLQHELKGKEREIEALQRKLATGGAAADDVPIEIEGTKLLVRRVAVGDAKALRAAADTFRDRLGSGVVVLGAVDEAGKATLLVAVTRDLESRVHAGKLVSALAHFVEGKGGGRADLAQAGGPKAAGLDEALAAAQATLEPMLRAS